VVGRQETIARIFYQGDQEFEGNHLAPFMIRTGCWDYVLECLGTFRCGGPTPERFPWVAQLIEEREADNLPEVVLAENLILWGPRTLSAPCEL
jgi:hypothetical protein